MGRMVEWKPFDFDATLCHILPYNIFCNSHICTEAMYCRASRIYCYMPTTALLYKLLHHIEGDSLGIQQYNVCVGQWKRIRSPALEWKTLCSLGYCDQMFSQIRERERNADSVNAVEFRTEWTESESCIQPPTLEEMFYELNNQERRQSGIHRTCDDISIYFRCVRTAQVW